MSQETKLNNAGNVIRKMFEGREYVFDEEKDYMQIYNKPDKTKICAFLKIFPKLNISDFRDHISIIDGLEIKHMLIIYEEKYTPAVKDLQKKYVNLGYTIEIFNIEELQFDITQYKYQPIFTQLSKKESKEFHDKFGTDIPRMLRTDPIARYYNYYRGAIIKIERKSGYISYRIVC